MPTVVAPGALGPVVEALAAQPGLVGSRVYDRVPASGTYPLIVCTTISEGESGPSWLETRIQLDVWGRGADPTAHVETLALGKALRAALRDLAGNWTTGRIIAVRYLTGADRPDPVTGRHRFLMDIFVHTHS